VVDLAELLADLAEEADALDRLVAGRPETDWARPTPADGWTVAHQVAHLAWTDDLAVRAVTDPAAFAAALAEAAEDPERFVDRAAAERLAPVAELLAGWRAGRAALAEALRTTPPGARIPWLGTTMTPAAMTTARLMETWAHGQDVADALGVRRRPTARLRHVAFLGVRTLGHSFATPGRPPPADPVRVELEAPDGGRWSYGPPDAADRVVGPALDFCLLVTRRRHRADLALVATGPVAHDWLDLAQAFAGPPGPGRAPAAAPA
jgi:uncharacterized protein (TIGR03084 family)